MRAAAALSTVVLAIVVAVSGAAVAPAQEPADRAPTSLLDLVPPEALLEPPPLNESARLLARGRRVMPFCAGIQTLADLPEPHPEDLDALVAFAGRYHGTLASMQLTVELPEDRQGVRRRVPLPAARERALLAQQAQMYAYMTRLTFIRSAVSFLRTSQSDPQLRARLQAVAGDLSALREEADRLIEQALHTAFLQLVNSSFTAAERTLQQARPEYCR